jgi:hypothetical protein
MNLKLTAGEVWLRRLGLWLCSPKPIPLAFPGFEPYVSLLFRPGIRNKSPHFLQTWIMEKQPGWRGFLALDHQTAPEYLDQLANIGMFAEFVALNPQTTPWTLARLMTQYTSKKDKYGKTIMDILNRRTKGEKLDLLRKEFLPKLTEIKDPLKDYIRISPRGIAPAPGLIYGTYSNTAAPNDF